MIDLKMFSKSNQISNTKYQLSNTKYQKLNIKKIILSNPLNSIQILQLTSAGISPQKSPEKFVRQQTTETQSLLQGILGEPNGRGYEGLWPDPKRREGRNLTLREVQTAVLLQENVRQSDGAQGQGSRGCSLRI